MSEIVKTKIEKVEKTDIEAPNIEPGGTAIVFHRHERYERDRQAENSGSLLPEAAEAARERYKKFFEDVLSQEDGTETMFLFVSSDTQYNGSGYRSLETAQLAQDTAIEVMQAAEIDPSERIINLNPNFNTRQSEVTGQTIRPAAAIREPQIFDTPEYVDHLKEKYGGEDGPGTGMSPEAWAAHESDQEKEVREKLGAEGVREMLDRTKKFLKLLKRYSKAFHSSNPNKRLVIWGASHYDTISPLVKDATGTDFSEYVPVDYGGGVVIDIPPEDGEAELRAQNKKVKLALGKSSTRELTPSN